MTRSHTNDREPRPGPPASKLPARYPPAFSRDPYLTSVETRLLRSGEDGRGRYVIPQDTVLYPAGGGQPSDRGTLSGIPVVGLARTEDGIRHYLAGPAGAEATDSKSPGAPVLIKLDWPRRFDHMQQHTAQHLLTALGESRFRWDTTSFHLGEEVCDIELRAPSLPAAALSELEARANAIAGEARPVSVATVSADEYRSRSDIRTRGLPGHHAGDVRIVDISGLDRTACGGTHVRNTAEVGAIKLLGDEPMRGGTRLFWVAGGRTLSRLAGHESRTRTLRTILGVGNDELPAAVLERMDQLRGLRKRARSLEDELAKAQAHALLARGGRCQHAHFKGKDGGFLRKVAHRFADSATSESALLTAEANGSAYFALAAGPLAARSLRGGSFRELGNAVARILKGRGGGKGQLFQGRAGSLARLEEAHTLVSEAVG